MFSCVTSLSVRGGKEIKEKETDTQTNVIKEQSSSDSAGNDGNISDNLDIIKGQSEDDKEQTGVDLDFREVADDIAKNNEVLNETNLDNSQSNNTSTEDEIDKTPPKISKIICISHPLYPALPEKITSKIREDETERLRSEMLYLSINNSTGDELKRMAKIYNADENIGSLKSFLFDKMGVDVKKINSEKESKTQDSQDLASQKEKYSFSINNADVIERVSVNGIDFIYIDGNVSIEFDVSGSKRTLKSDSILYDTSRNEILAFGNISITTSSGDSQLQDIKSEGLFLNFNSNKIRLLSATGSTQRSNSTYYMSGDEITLDSKSGEIYFQEGALLPNDDVNNANWRIASKDIIMKNNGDLFLYGILLKIGRVPILPLPAIFMPAKPLVFNPAIGFASDKGAFVNTTYELYGEYPNLGKAGEGNSFTNLFKSSSNAKVRKNGILYEVGEDTNASTNGNYMALFADVYQKEGLFVGIDTKNRFTPQNITIDTIGGVAYRPSVEPEYYTSTTYRQFRYLMDTNFKASYLGVNAQVTLPFYSDPGAKSAYLNRFTGFSFDSIFGSSQKFPETYSSLSGNEFVWNADFTYSLPSKLQTKYLNSLSLKTSLTHTRYWSKDKFSDDKYYKFISSSTTLPSFSLNASGTIFSFVAKSSTSNKEITKAADANLDTKDYSQSIENELLILRDRVKNKDTNNETDIDADEEDSSGIDVQENDEDKEDNDKDGAENNEQEDKDEFKFDNKRYTATASLSNNTSEGKTFFTGSNLSLKYTLSDTFNNIFKEPREAKKILGERRTTNSLSGVFTLAGGIGNNIFTFTQNIKPTYTYNFQEDSKNLEKNELVISSTTSANIAYFGLGYNLGLQIFSHKSTKDDDTAKTVTEDIAKFDKEHVNTHNLSFSKTFGFVGLSLSGNLPPLSLSFNPRLSLSFKKVNMWLMHTVKGENFEKIDNYQTEGRIGYSNAYVTTSATIRYDWEEAKKTNHFFRPFKLDESLSLSFLNSWIRVSQSISYLGVATSGEENYFQAINTSFSTKNNYFVFNISWKGPAEALDLNTTTLSISLPTFSFAFWKNRIVTTLGFKTNANLDFKDAYQNSLSYNINLKFEIKEFIELSFSLEGENNNFTKYTGGSRTGNFNFGEFLLDILRGINILNVSDMITSNFKMSGLYVKAVHDMGDWDLNFEFKGSFEASGNEYQFVPKYTVTLKWKVIPELKVDKTITL